MFKEMALQKRAGQKGADKRARPQKSAGHIHVRARRQMSAGLKSANRSAQLVQSLKYIYTFVMRF